MLRISETATRAKLIDPLLTAAGWNLKDRTEVDFEIPVDGYDKEPWNGITDYCLFDPSGQVLAIVEAKKTSRHPRDGQEQLRIYLDKVSAREGQSFVPFGFMTNGQDIFFWDVGAENPRLVAGFFTRDDLKRLLFIRQHGTPLESAGINGSIVERSYQHEAIRRVTEAFAKKKRRALLVMATGTGKTRTTMALIDLFQRTNQAQNVLFLADRDALVEQALTDGFKTHLPHEPRDRIYTHNIDTTKRLFVATEQTMNLCFDKFSPGFFDLIIFDEAHRSIFQRFTQVIDYFDARMIGLTATPANFIDRDTFRIFDCANQTPTFLYTFKQADNDKHLVDFSLYKAQTGFQRKGIKGVDLSEEDRNALIDQGIDPDALDYEGSDLEVDVSNKDTLRKQWEEIMEVCLKDQSGQLPGKTIVFAMTKKHAERVRAVFEEMYPQHVGLIQVITSSTERVRDGSYGAGLITKFKQNDLARIAIFKLTLLLLSGDEVPEMAYGERDGDRYQHTEGIKLSGRRLPADIPKSKLIGSSITKLDPKKQLREAGYPFDHIGSELIRLDGKFEMVSRDVASLAQKIEGETKSVVDKIEETKRWLVEHVENLFSKKFLWLVGTFIGGVAVLYAILGFLKTLALPDSALVVITAIGGITILVASTLLSQKRG